MEEWKKYEEQIFNKLRKEFPDSEILKDQRIIGKFSEISRQIDILVKVDAIGKDLLIVIDCKKFNKKVDIKIVESFIGMLDDVGANMGVLITNKGYTKGAKSRVDNYTKDVRLDVIEYSKLENYSFYLWEYCNSCEDIIRGEISWSKESISIDEKKNVSLIEGNCNYCGSIHYKCLKCSVYFDAYEITVEQCDCGNEFELKEVYIGSGMTENSINLRKK